MKITGRVWLFGDNLNSDQIMPVHHSLAEKEKYTCLNSVRPEFATNVKPGDIIVAGKNCGIGSSRPSPRILKYLEIGTVVADSFSGIFYRNAIAVGFPLAQVKDAPSYFTEGELLEVDFDRGIITKVETGEQITFPAYPSELEKIIEAGGIKELLTKQLHQ
ncbi:MAG: 3-isopropylmalate dehydratase [Sphaerochaetaceae bacterium]